MGPLHGFRIIEMSSIGPVPFCGMLLSDMGADVVRIDRAGTPAAHSDNPVNRGRRSIALDLKQDHDRQLLLSLIDKADALIEGYRPGVMERLQLGPSSCLARNPRLVYGRMTGWGQNGPLSAAAGHDLNYIALTGALHAMAGKNGHPHPPLNLVGDYGGGALYLAMGVLAALLETSRSGQGQVVDAAMIDGAASLMTLFYGMMNAGQWQTQPGHNLLDGGVPYYDCYRCADGKFISVAALEPQFYAELLQRCNLADDAMQARHKPMNWPQQRARLEQLFASQSQQHWCELLEATDVCFAPVLDMTEAPLHAHNRARQTFIPSGGGWQPAPAPRFSRTQSRISGPPPEHNQHQQDILRDWAVAAAPSTEVSG